MTIRFWWAIQPPEADYARVRPVEDVGDRNLCCAPGGIGRVEWETGSDAIGDFTWSSSGHLFMTTGSAATLASGGVTGFDCVPVEIKAVSRPSRSTASSRLHCRNRDELMPREWADLCEMRVTRWVNLDLQKSTVKRPRLCGTCGRRLYEPRGVEHFRMEWDPSAREASWERSPRREGMGLYVNASQLDGDSVFRVQEWPSMVFVTDRAKHVIEEAGLTDVTFLEYGELLEDYD